MLLTFLKAILFVAAAIQLSNVNSQKISEGGLIYERCNNTFPCAPGGQCVSNGTQGCGGVDNFPCFCVATDTSCTVGSCNEGERCSLLVLSTGIVDICSSCFLNTTDFQSLNATDPESSECDNVWDRGYTGDACSFFYPDCKGTRFCVAATNTSNIRACPFNGEECQCLPFAFTSCEDSSDCEENEQCAQTNDSSEKYCYSCAYVLSRKSFFSFIGSDETCSGLPDGMEDEDTTSEPSSTVEEEEEEEEEETTSPTSSVNIPPVITENPSADESIAPSLVPTSTPDFEINISPSSSPESSIESISSTSPQASEEEILESQSMEPEVPPCIHVDMLSGHSLVYNEHIRASVLCDSTNSCATAHHIVVYKNKAMSMRSYCNIVKCKRRIAWVNSPRMEKGLRVKSNTKDMQFTALAAKYSSWYEEKLLSLLVHMGI